MKAGVVFDLDETLIDRQASIAAYGRQLHDDLRPHIRQPAEVFLERFLQLDGNGYVPREVFFAHMADDLGNPAVSAATLAEHFAAHAWTAPIAMRGALDLCRRLRAGGTPIGVVTNGGSRNQRRKLENSGLVALVDQVLISEELGARKPDPAIFLAACERLGIDARLSWFVGDNPELDIVGAHGVGFRTVWLQRAMPWPEQHPRCYDRQATNLEDVADAIAD